MFEMIYLLIYRILRKTVFFLMAGLMCLSSFAPPADEPPQYFNKDTGNFFLPDYGNTIVSSHRSGKGAAPENTLMAIKSNLKFSEEDSAIIEMDVQLTKDGEIVLLISQYVALSQK